jgi:hypothetical protein
MFAAVVGHRSGRATPSLRGAPQRQSMEIVRRETIYRNRNAVQTNPATSEFFCKAIKVQGAPPRTITLDGYAASHRAVRDMQAGGQLPADTKLRSSKYLNCVMLRFALRVAARLVSPASGVARSPVIGHIIANTRRVVPRRRRGADCRVLSITCRRALSKMGMSMTGRLP